MSARPRAQPRRSWPTPRPSQGERLAIRPGVAAIIHSDRGWLLHRRRVGDGWAPVSGHVEPGETLTAALHREILEETGLTVAVERLVSLYSDPAFQIVAYPDGRRVQFVTALFACRVTGGRLRGSDEGTEWGWFLPSDLPEPLLPYARVWLADAASAPSGEPVIR
jgi:ADP-ribose pyrophosphatase YjhB (NUDIX family)